MNGNLITPQRACRLLKVCQNTLINWAENGELECVRTTGGHRRYTLSSVLTKSNPGTEPISVKKNYCYARVSSSGQKEDLERQIEYLRERYPSHTIVRDIGSGINFKRKGFQTLVDSAIQGHIGEVVVTHKDRLCRFGFDLVEGLISKYSNGKIVVLDRKETSPDEDLVNDLVSIITVFSSRLYGLRSHKVEKAIREATCVPKRQDPENKIISN